MAVMHVQGAQLELTPAASDDESAGFFVDVEASRSQREQHLVRVCETPSSSSSSSPWRCAGLVVGIFITGCLLAAQIHYKADTVPAPVLYSLQRGNVSLLQRTEVRQATANGPAVPPPGAKAHSAVRVWTPGPGHGAICQDGPLPPLCRPKEVAGHVQRVRVLTFNLKWWATFGRLYKQQQPLGNAITYRLRQWNAAFPFDVLGFQECADGEWLLAQAGLATEYQIFRARQCCMAYRKTAWRMLSNGAGYVATDVQYGLRPAQWLRLQHKQTRRVLFFVNHHGPMPVGSGGVCGGKSSAYQILKLISLRARCGDALVLVGDFNMGPSSPTITRLKQRLHISGHAYGQRIDHIFSNLPHSAVLKTQNLGSFGSDHDALSATFQMGTGPPPAKSSTTTLAPRPPVVPGHCAGTGDDPHASGSEQRCCPGLKKCLRRDQAWSFRCQACQAQCPDEPRQDFARRPCEAATTTEQPAAVSFGDNHVSNGDGHCVAEDEDPHSTGHERHCCPGLKKCLRQDQGWQFRCQRCGTSCRGDRNFTSRACELDKPRPTSDNVAVVLLGSDGACVEEGDDPFTSGNEKLCCMGLKKCLHKGKYRCQACHSACLDDDEFLTRHCQR